MKRFYPNKSRIITVKVALTTDQIAVLLNHAIYQSRPLDVDKELQFAVDWILCAEGVYAESAEVLRGEGYKALPFERALLPDPQDEGRERAREKRRAKARRMAGLG